MSEEPTPLAAPSPASTDWVPLWDTGQSTTGQYFGSIPGEIKLWPGGALPTAARYGKWVWADGAIYDTALYPEAAANIATAWRTAFGAADPGGGKFRVPDLRGVTPHGMDGMPGGTRANRTARAAAATQAANGGEEYHALTQAELAAHAHVVTDPGHGHSLNDPQHTHPPGFQLLLCAQPGAGSSAYVINSSGGTSMLSPTGIGINSTGTGVSLQNTGGGGAHENLPPSVFVPYIVRLDG